MLPLSPLGLVATALVLGFGWAGLVAAQQPPATAASGVVTSPESTEVQRLLKDVGARIVGSPAVKP